MSSYSHQNYTRQWCNETGFPVVSVDYRLAPEHPFPAALDDCWNAYLWVCEHSHSLLGTRPERILLAGDSAGGNLAAAVAVRAVMERSPIQPSGLLLCYPALRLDLSQFSPSVLLCLEDRLLPYTFLRGAIEGYLGSAEATRDPRVLSNPLVSPAVAPDEVLARLPCTRILVGDCDPLRDESIRFAARLERLGVNVSLRVYEGLPHGFLSLDTDFVHWRALRDAAHATVLASIDALMEM
jgi:hormone-sensitive lipase